MNRAGIDQMIDLACEKVLGNMSAEENIGSITNEILDLLYIANPREFEAKEEEAKEEAGLICPEIFEITFPNSAEKLYEVLKMIEPKKIQHMIHKKDEFSEHMLEFTRNLNEISSEIHEDLAEHDRRFSQEKPYFKIVERKIAQKMSQNLKNDRSIKDYRQLLRFALRCEASEYDKGQKERLKNERAITMLRYIAYRIIVSNYTLANVDAVEKKRSSAGDEYRANAVKIFTNSVSKILGIKADFSQDSLSKEELKKTMNLFLMFMQNPDAAILYKGLYLDNIFKDEVNIGAEDLDHMGDLLFEQIDKKQKYILTNAYSIDKLGDLDVILSFFPNRDEGSDFEFDVCDLSVTVSFSKTAFQTVYSRYLDIKSGESDESLEYFSPDLFGQFIFGIRRSDGKLVIDPLNIELEKVVKNKRFVKLLRLVILKRIRDFVTDIPGNIDFSKICGKKVRAKKRQQIGKEYLRILKIEKEKIPRKTDRLSPNGKPFYKRKLEDGLFLLDSESMGVKEVLQEILDKDNAS